ncbi:MAG: TIGR04053 family radical SAM/SPASM domain-containing protein [Candidatus Promineifilaceae bacterium]|nr:TIGR04053 family radical SAM/SPASM domain-containing protein [Candidatus Promineifilaceae bacterium]
MESTNRIRPIGPVEQFAYERAPLLIYWEATRACDLACLHCRAEAVAQRHPLELQTEEVRQLLIQIAAFGGARPPHLIITGGDPLQRPDLFELIAAGREMGIPISVTPAGTKRLTPAAIERLQASGISSLGLSLDGSESRLHDAFRGEPGSFRWTVEGAKAARAAGLPVQINTMVTAKTLADIPAIYEEVKELGIARWALFFLIATGRGEALEGITPAESERFLNWLWRLAPDAPFPIKTTEAHHYRRIAYLKMRSQGMTPDAILASPVGRGFGIRDGNGIVFISHTGMIYPSGFLPLAAGNVRGQNLVDVYRHSKLFRSLRDPNRLQGKCGRCEFRALCGGSRARAYADAGDPLAADFLCPYQPREREGRDNDLI